MKKIILIFMVVFLVGCSNFYNDINNLAIINEIAIDYEDNYKVYIKVLSSNQENESIVYYEEGDSLNECFSSLNNKLTKKLYLAHLDLLVLSNNLSKNEYQEIIDFFLKEESSRNTFKTIVISNINDDFLEINSNDIENLLDLSISTNGLAEAKTFDNIIKDILNYKISYIPYLDSENIEIKGLKTIYEENKILSKDESIAVNFIFNSIDDITLLIDEKSYKLEDCNTTIGIDDKNITIKISCKFKGNNSDKRKIDNYLNNVIDNFLKNNSKNYFYYLEDKYNLKGKIEIKKDINISLIKESSGDYFV